MRSNTLSGLVITEIKSKGSDFMFNLKTENGKSIVVHRGKRIVFEDMLDALEYISVFTVLHKKARKNNGDV